jgi:tripartite-type tricarboxylate transporter receptor subunit TctC
MKKILFCILYLFCQSISAHNIKLVVPFAPGGPADSVARLIQKDLSQELNKSIVLEFKAGASGEIGTAIVANAESENLLLLLNGPGIITTSLLKDKLSYNENNLIPLVNIGYTPCVLVVSKKSQIKNFKDLQNIDASRPITYGSSGYATATNLAGESLKLQLNKNFIHVPYKGSGAAIPNLISGDIDALIIGYNSVLQFIESEQVVPLAIESDFRLPSLPNVPTFKELGVDDPGKHIWLTLFSNNTADTETQQQVKQVLIKILSNPEKFKNYENLGFRPMATLLPTTDFFQVEKRKYRPILKNINIER